jgi:DNA-binding transcriptional MerR regulator
MSRYQLVRPARLSLDTVARRSELHPVQIRRLVALGLLDCTSDASGQLWFEPSTMATLARVQRLRSELSLNYAAIGLVMDLLDRIRVLEAQVRSRQPWT